MTPPSSSGPLEAISRVMNGYLDRDLEPSEIQNLTEAVTDHLLPLAQHQRTILILGSYEEESHWKLKATQSQLNELHREQAQSNCYSFLMEDVPGEDIWINAEVKFRLLADIADYIIGVVEHDRGGFLFEQGIISTNEDYRGKTHFLKYRYPTESEEKDNYSFMQSKGLFQKFESSGRLNEWSNNEELIDSCNRVFQSINSG